MSSQDNKTFTSSIPNLMNGESTRSDLMKKKIVQQEDKQFYIDVFKSW